MVVKELLNGMQKKSFSFHAESVGSNSKSNKSSTIRSNNEEVLLAILNFNFISIKDDSFILISLFSFHTQLLGVDDDADDVELELKTTGIK